MHHYAMPMAYHSFHGFFWGPLLLILGVVFLVFFLRRCAPWRGCGYGGGYHGFHTHTTPRYPNYGELVDEVAALKEEVRKLREKPAPAEKPAAPQAPNVSTTE